MLQEEAEIWAGHHQEHPPVTAALGKQRLALPELVTARPRQALPLPG